jgi:hypothetical protein
MKRSLSISATLVLALGLTSCTFLDELLNVNLFAEQMELSASDVQSSSISELLQLSESPSFYEAISEHKTELLFRIDDILSEATDPQEIQEAAILAADIIIYTSPAGELLANAAKLADGVDEEATIDEVLALILPSSIYSGGAVVDEVAFKAMIAAFEDANDYFIDIGDSIVGGEYASSAANAGDIAMGAFIGAVLGSVTPAEGHTDLDEYLLAALKGELATPPEFTIPDTMTPEYSYLDNILAAANLDSLLDL